MEVRWGPNWEDDLAGVCETGGDDVNFKALDHRGYLRFRDVFMFWLPRICEHCLNPACVASCPSGALYKRDEDGICWRERSCGRCRAQERERAPQIGTCAMPECGNAITGYERELYDGCCSETCYEDWMSMIVGTCSSPYCKEPITRGQALQFSNCCDEQCYDASMRFSYL